MPVEQDVKELPPDKRPRPRGTVRTYWALSGGYWRGKTARTAWFLTGISTVLVIANMLYSTASISHETSDRPSR